MFPNLNYIPQSDIKSARFMISGMTSKVPVLMRVLASSVDLASRASEIIRDVMASKHLDIVDKGVDDFQSKADRDSQRCIVGSLLKSFPGLKIVGEEGALPAGDIETFTGMNSVVLSKTCPGEFASTTLDDMVVWVDPLDGTKEFTEGLTEQVTVLIGIAVKGKPVAGVIAQPFYHPRTCSEPTTRTIWGLDGLGIFGLTPHLPGTVPYPLDPNVPKGSIKHTVVVTRSHPTPTLQATIDSCFPTEVLRVGGCGYKVITLLEGLAHVYLFPSPGCKRWDTCAPEALLTSVGGRLTDLFGESYDYSYTLDPVDRRGVLAAMVADWIPKYAACIPKDVLETLK
ncbi:unnamed protein product [Calicophoron daubneyi]|uniref:3'(2'),5'-bisphosphate nucleotidase 1 n=1 Tax=Calicophoron daubneyi TaxID=300641 RepID=A0AAV2TPJ7_CALDB